MQKLAAYRSEAAGLPDRMNYAALVDEGIVLGKDGSLIAGFHFRGDDAGSASAADQNYLTAMVNNYLARFGSGWAIWIDATKKSSPGYPAPSLSHFPDPVSAMIDAERREMFERMEAHYESEYALILQYLPPVRKEAALTEIFYSDDGKSDTNTADRTLAEFKKKVRDLQDGLGDMLHMRRMGTITVDGDYDSDELINHLHFCITGEYIRLRIPDCPMYLDSWLGYESFRPGNIPKIGSKFIACVAIDGFPSSSQPGMLSLFEGFPLSYRWSTRFIFLDQHEAISALKRLHGKWKQKERGFFSQVFRTGSGMVNTDAVEQAQHVEHALGAAQSGLIAYGYYTPVLVLLNEDRQILEEQARYVKKEIERRGYFARVEEVNTVEAWLGSLPGHAYPNVRRPLIHTLNLSDLLPLSGVWPGLHENPCPFYPEGSPPLMHVITTGSTPFRVNLHVSDVGHTLVFGPTGAGKSTLLAILAAQFLRYKSRPRPNGTSALATVTALDKGHSLYAACSATGGIHYDICADNLKLSLCPLAEIDSVSDALWAEEWLATCFELQTERKLSPLQKKRVHEAMEMMRRTEKEHRSLSEFLSSVQDEEVHDALAHYTVGGSLGRLLDGKYDSLGNSYFTVFEIDELMNLGKENAIPVLLYLFRRFERSLKGQPAMLLLDEAWVMLGHEVFRAKVREWLKELRKKNCVVVLATQNISDAVNSGMFEVLNEQCPTKILLPNKEADSPSSASFYEAFGLNDQEIAMLKNAQYKRQYYYRSPLGRRMFELGLGPLALSFVAVSDKDSLREVKAFEQEYGRDWPLYWLEKRGINYEKYTT